MGQHVFTPGPNGEIETERAATELGSPARGFVRYKSTFGADWLAGDFMTSLTVRYISALDERCPAGLAAFCTNGAAGNELGEKAVKSNPGMAGSRPEPAR